MRTLFSEDLFVERFAEEIRKQRKEQALSLKQVEDQSGVSASFIARIENGQRKNMSINVVLKLANGLGIDVVDLVAESRTVVKI